MPPRSQLIVASLCPPIELTAAEDDEMKKGGEDGRSRANFPLKLHSRKTFADTSYKAAAVRKSHVAVFTLLPEKSRCYY